MLPAEAEEARDAKRSRNCYSWERNVRRALASSLLSLLLFTTLMWGGCISCEQYFMWPRAKSCCSPDGHCKKQTPAQKDSGRDCTQIAFHHQKSIDLHVDSPAVAVIRFDLPLPSVDTTATDSGIPPAEPSPPDLQVLHSTFRI